MLLKVCLTSAHCLLVMAPGLVYSQKPASKQSLNHGSFSGALILWFEMDFITVDMSSSLPNCKPQAWPAQGFPLHSCGPDDDFKSVFNKAGQSITTSPNLTFKGG